MAESWRIDVKVTLDGTVSCHTPNPTDDELLDSIDQVFFNTAEITDWEMKGTPQKEDEDLNAST